MGEKAKHGGARVGGGRPRTNRDDKPVNVAQNIAKMAVFVAKVRSLPTAEYLSEILEGPVTRDFNKASRIVSGIEDTTPWSSDVNTRFADRRKESLKAMSNDSPWDGIAEAIDEKFAELEAPKPGVVVVANGARVGDAVRVPPRFETHTCTQCKHSIWIPSEVVEGAAKHKAILQPICDLCNFQNSAVKAARSLITEALTLQPPGSPRRQECIDAARTLYFEQAFKELGIPPGGKPHRDVMAILRKAFGEVLSEFKE